jgi:hypothetical protein
MNTVFVSILLAKFNTHRDRRVLCRIVLFSAINATILGGAKANVFYVLSIRSRTVFVSLRDTR